ncbi:MAG: hypothetical protein M3Q33_00150 [Acidobacteriota bacterium]|nr:hypothetical protein [Acidobacteriota bacterium]
MNATSEKAFRGLPLPNFTTNDLRIKADFPKSMKRINEKVKDLIEVRSYKILHDFISDPAQTLSAYYFTDVTSDLMAKWLDKVVAVHSRKGAACALAGYRGVGKSLFLATLGAIVSHPELRSRVAEPHVAASAQRLKRNRYSVGYVRRGTHETLFEELKDAIAKTFETDAANLGDSLTNLLNLAAENNEPEFSEASVHLIEILESREEVQFLTNNELIILQKVFEALPTSDRSANLPLANVSGDASFIYSSTLD